MEKIPGKGIRKAFYKNGLSDWAPAWNGVHCTVNLDDQNSSGIYCYEYGWKINRDPKYLTILDEKEVNEFGEVSP